MEETSRSPGIASHISVGGKAELCAPIRKQIFAGGGLSISYELLNLL
jgi:hypothetical protein